MSPRYGLNFGQQEQQNLGWSAPLMSDTNIARYSQGGGGNGSQGNETARVSEVLQGLLGGVPKTGQIGGQGMFNKIGGLEGLSSIMGGVGDLAGAYAAIKGLGIAKDQLKFSKEFANKNLANQTQSYNTALDGKMKAQYAYEGKGASDVEQYLAKHSL